MSAMTSAMLAEIESGSAMAIPAHSETLTERPHRVQMMCSARSCGTREKAASNGLVEVSKSLAIEDSASSSLPWSGW